MMKHITMEAIQEVYINTTPEILNIADLGCSSGRNSLSMISDLYHAVEDAHRKTPTHGGPTSTTTTAKVAKVLTVSVYLNDLPTNDFNSIFRALPEFFLKEEGSMIQKQGHFRPSLFIAASPGSFYGPIFPPNFLHFIYSSYSLHWLSKVLPLFQFNYRIIMLEYYNFVLKYLIT